MVLPVWEYGGWRTATRWNGSNGPAMVELSQFKDYDVAARADPTLERIQGKELRTAVWSPYGCPTISMPEEQCDEGPEQSVAHPAH